MEAFANTVPEPNRYGIVSQAEISINNNKAMVTQTVIANDLETNWRSYLRTDTLLGARLYYSGGYHLMMKISGFNFSTWGA